MSDDEFEFSRTLSASSFRPITEPDIPYPLPSVRNLHEEDKSCSNCGSKLDINGVAHSMKQVCKFCYRGICGRCIGYEYFHPESKTMERMCNNCHSRSVAMSEEFANEIRTSRLDKIQIKQLLEEAIKERNEFTGQRKEAESELGQVRESLVLSNSDKDNIHSKLQEENEVLQEKHRVLEIKLSDTVMTVGLLKSRYQNLKSSMQTMKNQYEKEMEHVNQLKDEHNELQMKKAALMRNFDPSISEEVEKSVVLENLAEEISKLDDQLKEVLAKNSQLEEIIIDCAEECKRNQRTIEKMTESLQIMRSQSSSNNELTAEEQLKLEERRQQIKEDDEEIEKLEHTLRAITAKSSLYIVSPELPDKKSPSNLGNSSEKGSDYSCSRCVVI